MRKRINRNRKAKMHGGKARTSKRRDTPNSRRHSGTASVGDTANSALSSSEQELRLLIDTIPALVWTAGPEGNVEYVNKRVLEYLGATLDDITGNGWVDKIHPDDVAYKARTWLANLESRTAHDAVCRFRGADGQYRWFSVSGAPLKASDGRVIRWYGVLIDRDERKKAQDRLRRSEAYLAAAQRLSQTGTWVLDRVTLQYLYWSDECYRIWAFDPLLGLPTNKALWQRIHSDDRERVQQNVEEAVRQKETYLSDGFRIVLPDGTVKYLTVTCHLLYSTNRELVEVIGTNVDVTEYKLAEQALRASEEKFRDYAETASDWLWEVGPDYKFTLLTENAFGSESADRIGTACWDHALDLEAEPEKWRLLQATLDARKPFRDFVYCSARPHESPIYVKASGKPVFDTDGEFHGYRGTGTDVTALIQAQEEHERLRQLESDLAHMNRLSMMGELAASLAHEIAQPIATARNNARAAMHFLDRSKPDPGEVREALACIVDDADRAGDILDRIRDHIKKAPPRKERVDLNKAINDVIALARSAIIKNEVTVQTRLTEGLSDVFADRVQLQQVVLNLILNAVEAMSSVKKGARELSISTEKHHAGGVLVEVHDSGPGIDSKHLDRIFDAFYTTKSSGVGMGLSICRSIIHAHGGRLWADVNTPRGATFRFSLPGVNEKLTNPFRPAYLGHESSEHTVSDSAH